MFCPGEVKGGTMSIERQIKSFRLEGECPFKAYNFALSSSLVFADLEQYVPLPKAISSPMQQHLEHPRQQQRFSLSHQTNQPLQQIHGDLEDYLCNNNHQQQILQKNPLTTELSSLLSSDPNHGDKGKSLKRPDVSNNSLHLNDHNLSMSNPVFSLNDLHNFITSSGNTFKTTISGSAIDQDSISMLLDHPVSFLGGSVSRYTENSDSMNSVVASQCPQNVSTLPQIAVKEGSEINWLGGGQMPSMNMNNFILKHEINEGSSHSSESSSGSPELVKQNKSDEDSFTDSIKCNMQSSVSEFMQMKSISQDKRPGSGIVRSDSTEKNNRREASKDPAYLEKRRKNNESAKRSREARRTKEELMAFRVIGLEEENMKLRAEICLLDKELDELRSRLYQCG